jgi:hypothetical protein
VKLDPPAAPLRYRSPSQITRRPSQMNPIPAPPAKPPLSPMRFLPAVLGVAVLAAAFLAGRATAPRAAVVAGADGDNGVDPAGDARAADSTASARMAERLRSLGGNTAFARSGSTPVGLEALETLNRLPSSEQREEERLRMIEQWAATAPEAALEYTRQNLKGDRQVQAVGKVLTAWAKHAPAAAWQWARKQGAGDVHNAQLVMEEIARNSPATAARFATEFALKEPRDAREMAMVAIRGMTYDGNFDAARQFVAGLSLPTPEEQVGLVSSLAELWGRHNPEQAMAWARALPEGPGRTQALASLGDAWAEADPARAAAFAEQLPAGQARQTALQQAVSHWNLNDPAAVNEWISHASPSPDFDQAVASLATQPGMMQQHVDQSLGWAAAIRDPSLRLSTMRDVVSDWAVRDRAAALSYVQSSPRLSADTRGALLAHLGQR